MFQGTNRVIIKTVTNSNWNCIPHRMASSPGNQKATHSENSQGKKSQHAEEAIFYMNCRAAYLTVLKSSLDNIKSKEQLSLGNDWIFSPLTLTWDDCSESIPVHKLSNWFKELRVVLDACWKWECQTELFICKSPVRRVSVQFRVGHCPGTENHHNWCSIRILTPYLISC